MPNFDKTGPQRKGPMTGRKMGNCTCSDMQGQGLGMNGQANPARGRGRVCPQGTQGKGQRRINN